MPCPLVSPLINSKLINYRKIFLHRRVSLALRLFLLTDNANDLNCPHGLSLFSCHRMIKSETSFLKAFFRQDTFK